MGKTDTPKSLAGALAGKTAFVTGATSGIGAAILEALAEAGAEVVFNGFASEDQITLQLADLEKRFAIRASYVEGDLRHSDAIETMMAQILAEKGAVDILVNNAGIQHVAPIESFPSDKWDDVIAINLTAAFHTTRLVIPGMRKKGWGRIINIASVHGLVASANKSAYVTAKHGLVGLTKTTALELAREGITCNAICPGWVYTPLVQKQVEARAVERSVSADQAKRELIAEKMPNQDFVTGAQLGALAVFLCSEAAQSLTGAQVPVDGGWVAQ